MRRSEACTEPETAPCNSQHKSCVSPDAPAPLLTTTCRCCCLKTSGATVTKAVSSFSFQPGPPVSRCLTVSTDRNDESAFWTRPVMNEETPTEITPGRRKTREKLKSNRMKAV